MLVEGEGLIAAALNEDLGRPTNDSFLGDIAATLAKVRLPASTSRAG